MTLVARGNLLIYSDMYSWNNSHLNLHNLNQGIVHTLYCVHIKNMAARGGNRGEI